MRNEKVTKANALEVLTAFVNQKPGLNWADYGDSRAYNQESREITRDRGDYLELVSIAAGRVEDLPGKVYEALKGDGRLCIGKDGRLEYTPGQYWCTEYRPAAARVIAGIVRQEFGRGEWGTDGAWNRVAAKLRRVCSRRVMRNYFN